MQGRTGWWDSVSWLAWEAVLCTPTGWREGGLSVPAQDTAPVTLTRFAKVCMHRVYYYYFV